MLFLGRAFARCLDKRGNTAVSDSRGSFKHQALHAVCTWPIKEVSTFQNAPMMCSFSLLTLSVLAQDCFAMGAQPSTALAMAVVPYGTDSKMEESLFHLMCGAVAVLNAAGCALVGGHTCEGDELALGPTFSPGSILLLHSMPHNHPTPWPYFHWHDHSSSCNV